MPRCSPGTARSGSPSKRCSARLTPSRKTGCGYGTWKDCRSRRSSRCTASQQALEPVNSPKSLRLLDVGCGSGRLSRRIHERGFSVLGVEGERSLGTPSPSRRLATSAPVPPQDAAGKPLPVDSVPCVSPRAQPASNQRLTPGQFHGAFRSTGLLAASSQKVACHGECAEGGVARGIQRDARRTVPRGSWAKGCGARRLYDWRRNALRASRSQGRSARLDGSRWQTPTPCRWCSSTPTDTASRRSTPIGRSRWWRPSMT